jgi:hypothetical protein
MAGFNAGGMADEPFILYLPDPPIKRRSYVLGPVARPHARDEPAPIPPKFVSWVYRPPKEIKPRDLGFARPEDPPFHGFASATVRWPELCRQREELIRSYGGEPGHWIAAGYDLEAAVSIVLDGLDTPPCPGPFARWRPT